MSYDIRLTLKVAELYYKDNLNQERIAKRLKISKYKVIKLLRIAKKEELIEIKIIDS